jgi:hypothetical protein
MLLQTFAVDAKKRLQGYSVCRLWDRNGARHALFAWGARNRLAMEGFTILEETHTTKSVQESFECSFQ